MATLHVVLHDTPRKDGWRPIRIRITQNRRYAYENLAYMHPRFWKNGRVTRSGPNAKELNALINQRVGQCQEIIAWLDKIGKPYTSREVLDYQYHAWRAMLAENPQAGHYSALSFDEYAQKLIAVKRKTNIRMAQRYVAELCDVQKYLKTIQRSKFELSDCNDEFISGFFHWCRNLPGRANSDNTLDRRLRFFKKILNHAYRNSVISRIPIVDTKLLRPKVAKRSLAREEIRLLEELQVPFVGKGRLRHAIDAWLLQYYLWGTRISDILSLKNSNVVLTETGQPTRIEFYQRKTGQFMSISFGNGLILDLVKRYWQPDKPDIFLLPWLSFTPYAHLTKEENKDRLDRNINSCTCNININLKKVVKLTGLNKQLSSHASRHSFASLAKRKKVDIYAISKALGHSSIAQTETYLGDLDFTDVDDAMKGLYD